MKEIDDLLKTLDDVHLIEVSDVISDEEYDKQMGYEWFKDEDLEITNYNLTHEKSEETCLFKS